MNMNIKISIAEIIISFEFDYQPFENKLRKILDKFIVKTDIIDVDITLNMVEDYDLIDGEKDFFITDLIDDKMATILQWNMNGELNLSKNTGVFNLHISKNNIYSIIKFILLNILPEYNGLLLHSSSMINKDLGIIGSGVSGSGKSTFAKKLASEGFTIFHDEITLIRKVDSSFNIYPTPFDNNPKHIVNFLEPKKLNSIFFIKQNDNNYIKNISLKKFYTEILKVIFAMNSLKHSSYFIILNIINNLYKDVVIKELSFDLNQNLTDKLY